MLSFIVRPKGALYRCVVIAASVSAFLWGSQTHALDAPSTGTGSVLNLEQAIRWTLEQNPELQVFEFRDLALDGEVQTANLRPPLEVGVELDNFAGSGVSSEAGLDNFAGSGVSSEAELTVSLSSVIELGGKRQERVATVGASRDYLDTQRQVEALNLVGEVTRRYVEVLAAQERLTLAHDAVALAQDTVIAVQRRVKAGATPEAEGLRASTALMRARLALQSEQQQLPYYKRALAALWGDTQATFTLDSHALYRFGPQVDFVELYDRARSNPAIEQFASEERLREAELRLAQTQSRADIGWSVGVRRSREIDETTLVAGFNLPLFSGRRNTGAITSAMAKRDEVAYRREAALLKLQTQLYGAVTNREQAAIAARTLGQDVVPTMKQALQQVELAYRRGGYSYLEWAATREDLITARRAQIEAAAAVLRYGAEIEQLTAEPLLPAQYDYSK